MSIVAVTTFLVAGATVGAGGAARALSQGKATPREVALYGVGAVGLAVVFLFYVAGWAVFVGEAGSETFLPDFPGERGRRGILWAYGAAAAGLAAIIVAGLSRLGVRRGQA